MSIETPSIRMVLRANNSSEIQVYQDEPLTLRVTLTNHSAISSTSRNASLLRRKRELDRRLANNQMTPEEHEAALADLEKKMTPAKTCRIGGPTAWPEVIRFQALSKNQWQDLVWPLVLMAQSPQGPVAEIGSKLCLAEFGLDPADRAEHPYGKFQVKAVVEIAKDEFAESNIVSLNLLQKPMPQAEKKKERALLDLGKYLYKRGLLNEAKEHAEQALKVNTDSLEALVLIADVQLSQGSASEALATYAKALEVSGNQGLKERPDYVIMQMTKIRSMLDKKEP